MTSIRIEGGDLKRIPLIKPYELVKTSDSEWRLNLLTTSLLTLSIHNVNRVNISKGQVFIYSKGNTEIRNKNYEEAWFILNPKTLSESAVLTRKAYNDSLRKMMVVDTVSYVPDELYETFSNTGALKWIEKSN